MSLRTKLNLTHAGLTLVASAGFLISPSTGAITVGAALGTWISISKPVERVCNHLTEAAKRASLQ